ncbi:hypothetical protein ACF0H5_013371 [Mactra antiquata]
MRDKQNEPGKVVKRYKKYSAKNLDLAYKAVIEKGLPVYRAARKHGVPGQTLRDRVKGIVDHENAKQGGHTFFSQKEELIIVEHVKTMAELGYGFTHTQLKHVGGKIAYEHGKKENSKPLSNCWLYGFLKRWNNEIAAIKPYDLDNSRSKSTTAENVRDFYLDFPQIFGTNNRPDKSQVTDECSSEQESHIENEKLEPKIKKKRNTKSKTMSNESPVEISEESDVEGKADGTDVCCVCKKENSPRLKEFPNLKIVNWGQCDKCCHWVHLTLCTNVNVIRRHSTFLCPHCVM